MTNTCHIYFRFVIIMALIPILNRLGYGLSARNAILLVFGGLKSSISILLGLAVIRNHEQHISNHAHQAYTSVTEQEHIVSTSYYFFLISALNSQLFM